MTVDKPRTAIRIATKTDHSVSWGARTSNMSCITMLQALRPSCRRVMRPCQRNRLCRVGCHSRRNQALSRAQTCIHPSEGSMRTIRSDWRAQVSCRMASTWQKHDDNVSATWPCTRLLLGQTVLLQLHTRFSYPHKHCRRSGHLARALGRELDVAHGRSPAALHLRRRPRSPSNVQ